MTTIKGTTKRGKAFIRDYELARNSSIWECYKKFSFRKQLAQDYCKQLMEKEKGRNFRILSYNTFQFTCGWMTDNGLRVETRDNSYLIELSNEQFLYL